MPYVSLRTENIEQRIGKVLWLVFVILFLIKTSIHSQVVNIENKRIYDDTVGWSGNISGVFSAIQNQDLLFLANFRPTAQYKSKNQNYFLIGDFTYSKGKEKLYANAGMFHFRFAQRIKSSPWKW
jgi:ABC-type transport system involved in multi-copper enzyme maturation permease subunit